MVIVGDIPQGDVLGARNDEGSLEQETTVLLL